MTSAWTKWDEERDAGGLPTEMARGLEDEDLARLLSDAGAGRDDERKLLAAEALRRTTDLEQVRNQETLAPDPEATARRLVVNRAAERVHAAERKLERLSSSQIAEPDLKRAHEASLLVEEHRAHVETNIELSADQREGLTKLHEAFQERKDALKKEGEQNDE